MSKVWVLWHVGPDFERDGDDGRSKLLGIFSSAEQARAWEGDAAALPGFRDSTDQFVLDEYTLDKREWPEGFVTETVPE